MLMFLEISVKGLVVSTTLVTAVAICMLGLLFPDLLARSLFWTPGPLDRLTCLSHTILFPSGKSRVHRHLPNLLPSGLPYFCEWHHYPSSSLCQKPFIFFHQKSLFLLSFSVYIHFITKSCRFCLLSIFQTHSIFSISTAIIRIPTISVQPA